ncbi:MAG: Ppx/GppA phosphatase family protein [Planctomycetota bacterium]|nr:Ppx/GppA phosphatase family protein [Planctomycetota bacterium]
MDEKQIYFSKDIAHRLAAIDIGSNSVRLMVAEPLRGGNYRILDEERESTRLGRNLGTTGGLSPESVELTLTALRRFKQIATGFQVDELRTIATCAVREASNGPDFCRRALDELGIEIEVISADKEARLAFYSVQRAFDLTGKNVVVADIGGGSTELVLASGNAIEAIHTSPLGAVRLTEIFGSDFTVDPKAYAVLIDGIDRRLRKLTKKPIFFPHLLIGSGGTFTALAEMIMAQKGQYDVPARGYSVTRAEVSHLLDRLRKIPPKNRRSVTGLAPDRADIIVAGIAVIDRIMARFKVNLLQVHNRGVRDGLVLTMIDQSSSISTDDPQQREAALERFAMACSGEPAHGRHVAKLAGKIFTQLAEPFGLAVADQPYLEAAARLQDVGYLINYDQHHKHSYHLILNSNLSGFRPRELELIANVARYHRGAYPKQKHDNFRQLPPEDQQRVRQLASILRIAGGLDRSHSQQVTDVELQWQASDKAVPRLTLLAKAAENPEVDIWGARRRVEMFETVFNCKLEIEWLDKSQAHNSSSNHAGENGSEAKSALRSESA